MIILVFDTCMDKMYVALSNGDELLDSKIVETTKSHYHSAFLISTIANILKKNDLKPQDVEVIATNVGPGSFTGIRACTTVARVFAQANNSKVIGVSSLEILSRINTEGKGKREKGKELRHCEEKSDEAIQKIDSILVALDARKEMAYVAIFEKGKQTFAPQTILLEDLKEMIANGDYFVVTDDKLQPILGGISYQQQSDDFGKYLIEITKAKLETDIETDWRKLHPLYIQPPPVSAKKLDK